MAGKGYLDKEQLINVSIHYLKDLKEKYALNAFIDCTPVNIGRDIELLKEVSQKSGVNIICSTGFYYTEEPVLYNSSAELIAEYIIKDAENINAGIIKCAVQNETISEFNKKLLIASALAQKMLSLPIVLHTNANNKNGLKALEILLSEGVKPQAITVGHLSDTEDLEYIKQIAKIGCFIGFDRLYDNSSEEYISKKIEAIAELCNAGYEDKILLSHDALFFNGFQANPAINKQPRFSYYFEYILPGLSKERAEQIIIKNPLKMLKCGE
jgi:phosphotriesterase-related protein